jgi:hypothetical protein
MSNRTIQEPKAQSLSSKTREVSSLKKAMETETTLHISEINHHIIYS